MLARRGLRFGWSTVCLFLIAACSAADSKDGSGDSGERDTSDPGVLPPLPNAAIPGANPTTPPTIGVGSNTGSPGAGESDPTPVAIDPGGSNPSPVPPSPAPDTNVDSSVDEPTPPPPTSATGALIRGADPSVQSATNPGPFDVQTTSDGLRDGPGYGTQTLHVPIGAEPPFASVVIVPGFVSPESSIKAWGPFLASHGIVALTIGTNSGGDSPDVRARALLDGIETLKAENTRSGGPLEGDMDLERFGVMGWSMGGGGTLIAANGNPNLRAAVSMAAWSPGVRFPEDTVPTLMLAGSADPLAGGQSQGFFESIPETTPKMLFEVAGGAHDIANNPRSANGEIGRYGLSWLKVFLEGDERYRQFLLETPSSQSDFKDNL